MPQTSANEIRTTFCASPARDRSPALKAELARTEGTVNSPATSSSSVAEIIRLHGQILDAARTSLDNAIRIGELLVQEKARLNHGEWLPWLKGHVPFSDRTARNYMQCYEQRDRLKMESVSDLTSAYRLLASPDRPGDLGGSLPDAKTLAGDISAAGKRRFDTCYAQAQLQIKNCLERLRAPGSLEEVLEIMRDADRLLLFWTEARLESERLMYQCLIEIERAAP